MGLTKNLGALPKVLTVSGSNIGVGVTSPTVKLDINGVVKSNDVFRSLGTSNAGFELGNSGTGGEFGFIKWDNASNYLYIGHSYNAVFNKNIVINSSGNVGIGTTNPDPFKLAVNGVIGINGTLGNTLGSLYIDHSGVQSWKIGVTTANTSTLSIGNDAGGAFVNKIMNFTNAGNVGIGTTSPVAKLTISDTNTVTNQLDFIGYGSTAKGHIGEFAGNLYISSNYFYNGTQNADTSSLGQSAIVLSAGTTTTSFIDFNLSDAGATNPTNKVRIISNGNVGINTSTPSSKLEVANGDIKLTDLYKIGWKYSVNDNNMYSWIENSYDGGSTNSGINYRAGMWTGGDVTAHNFYTWYNNTWYQRFYITNSGRVYLPATYALTSGAGANVGIESSGLLYRSTSSRKYKKNIQDYTKGLDQILQMRPVTYNSINESEDGILYAGLIAEEVHDLGLTEFVQYAEDETPDALYYANMVSLLVKGIQELTERIKILENK